MKKTTLSILATAVLLGTGSAALSFGGGPGGPGGPGAPMMYGPGMGSPMMHRKMMRGSRMGAPFMAQRIFAKADADKDGVVTRKEALAAKAALFAKFDANKDGVVNTAEIDRGLEAKINRIKTRMRYMMLARLDLNGDGVVSKEEFDRPGLRRFDRADANNDGKVTREEVQALGARAKGYMRSRGYGRHGRGPGGAW